MEINQRKLKEKKATRREKPRERKYIQATAKSFLSAKRYLLLKFNPPNHPPAFPFLCLSTGGNPSTSVRQGEDERKRNVKVVARTRQKQNGKEEELKRFSTMFQTMESVSTTETASHHFYQKS